MHLIKLPYRLTVAKYERMPEDITGFFSLTATGREISLVCETDRLPQGCVAREDGWRALMVEGQLDFSLVGILSGLSSVLAEAQIPLFAISTYDTDCLLVKESDLDHAVSALREAAYVIEEQ